MKTTPANVASAVRTCAVPCHADEKGAAGAGRVALSLSRTCVPAAGVSFFVSRDKHPLVSFIQGLSDKAYENHFTSRQ